MNSIFDDIFVACDPPDSPTDPNTNRREWQVAYLTGLWMKLLVADKQSASNRSAIQSLFDNAPPYIEGSRLNEGLEFLANFNPGDARAALNAAISPFVEMMKATEFPLRIRTNWGSDGQRSNHEGVMSEEWGRVVHGWSYWNFNFLHLSNIFVGHGVGIAYFLDDRNWQYRASGMADFKIPRMSYANEDEIEIAVCARAYLPHQLRAYITGTSVDPGWNVDAVESAIAEALKGADMGSDLNRELKPEMLAAEMKNGDPSLSYATNTVIRCIHAWGREPDGTITQLISLESGTNKNFLYKKTGRFKAMGDAFVFFTLNIGINGYYHSVRGLGEQIYNLAMELARMECRASDNAKVASSLLFQSLEEGAFTEAAINFIGPCGQLHKDAQIVAYEFPDATKTIFPVLNEQRTLLQNHIGQYAGPVSFNDSRVQTKFEVKARMGESASVSATSSTLFYESLQKLLRQMLRRFIRPDYRADEPGGKEVFDFIHRCLKRGVPLEAIRRIDVSRCEVVRAFGGGSSAEQQLIWDSVKELIPSMPAAGRYKAARNYLASLIGYDATEEYMPKLPDQSATGDEQIANVENTQLANGAAIPVLPTALHAAQAPIHLEQIQQMRQAIEQEESLLAQIFPGFMATLEHTTLHVEYLSADPFYAKESAEYRKILQEAQEIANNGAKELQRADEKAAMEAQQGGDAAPEAQINPQVLARVEENRMKLDAAEQSHQQALRHREDKFKQERSIADATAAAKMLRDPT